MRIEDKSLTPLVSQDVEGEGAPEEKEEGASEEKEEGEGGEEKKEEEA